MEKPTAKERREQLRAMSKTVAPLVEEGAFDTINDAIITTIYKDGEHSEFNTFHQWKDKGYKVKKGSTAFAVWGRPKKKQDAEQGKPVNEDEEDKLKFWPMAYLFSNAQVEPMEKKEAA